MKHEHEFEDRLLARIKRECHFGITEIGALIAASLVSAGVGTATAGVIGTVGAGALGGAALGAGSSALMGGDPGKGALYGGISGGALAGAGPVAAGLGATGNIAKGAIDVGMGAAGGAAGAAATGADPGMGAATGAAGGFAKGVMSAMSATPTTPGAAPAAAGPSAASSAAPASVGAAGPDLTAPVAAAGGEALTAPGAATVAPVTSATLPGVEQVAVEATRAGADVAGAAGAGVSAAGQSLVQGGDAKPPTGTDKSLATAPTAGSVGQGAATGTTSNVSGTNAPGSNVPGGAALSPAKSPLAPGGSDLGPGAVHIGDLDPNAATVTNPAGDAGASSLTATNLNAGELASGPTTSVGQFIADPSLSNAGNVLTSNPEAVLATGGLAAQMMMGNKQPPQVGTLNTQAQKDVAQGNMLQSYLTSGQLPPGMQINIDAQTKAAEAAIRQRYANMGMSGSTAEMQDIQAARMQAVGQAADMRTKLYQAGTQQSGLGVDIYNELLKITQEQDQNLSNAIGNFTSNLAGMGSNKKPNSATITLGA